MSTWWNEKAELQWLAIAASKCANAEFSPGEMRLWKSVFQYQGCKLYSLLILRGYLDYKHVHLHLHLPGAVSTSMVYLITTVFSHEITLGGDAITLMIVHSVLAPQVKTRHRRKQCSAQFYPGNKCTNANCCYKTVISMITCVVINNLPWLSPFLHLAYYSCKLAGT